MKRFVAAGIVAACLAASPCRANDLQKVEQALLALDWKTAREQILLLPDGELRQQQEKTRILLQSRLVFDYLAGVERFRKIAKVPQHRDAAASFYRRDLRFREELVPKELEYSRKLSEAVAAAREEVEAEMDVLTHRNSPKKGE